MKSKISQVPFNLVGFESAQHFGWGKRIYTKSPLSGYRFCEIFYFTIAHKRRRKFHKPVTLNSKVNQQSVLARYSGNKCLGYETVTVIIIIFELVQLL